MLNRIFSLYRKFFWSLEDRARLAGVEIGRNCFVASEFWSSEGYLIKIGDNCQITAGVKLFTHGGGAAIRHKYPDFDCFGKIKIGNYVYIGSNSLILPGVEIGDNVLVAAGSVVTKSIPSGWVVAGNPANFVCTIEEFEASNMRFNTHSKIMTPEEKKKLLLTMDESLFIKKKPMIRKE